MTTSQTSTQATSDWRATDQDCSFTFNGVECEVFRDWSCLVREDRATRTFITVEEMVRYLVGGRSEPIPITGWDYITHAATYLQPSGVVTSGDRSWPTIRNWYSDQLQEIRFRLLITGKTKGQIHLDGSCKVEDSPCFTGPSQLIEWVGEREYERGRASVHYETEGAIKEYARGTGDGRELGRQECAGGSGHAQCGPSYRDGVRDGIAQEREKTSRLGEFKRGFDVGQTKGDQAGYARGVRDGSEGLVKQTEEVAKREYQRGLADGQKRAGETKAGGFEAGFAQGYAAGGTGKVYEAGIAEGQKRADETHRQLAIALDKVTRTEAQRTTLNNKLAEALCNNGQLALTNSKLSADYQRVREQRDTLRIAEKELGERIDTLYKERDEMRQREEGLKQEAYNAGKKAQVERCDGHNASLLREIEELKRTSSLAFSVRYHQGLSDGACMQKIADDASANELKKKLENTEALLKAAYDRETKKAKDAEELANRLTLTENGRQHWQDEAGRLVAERDCLSRLLDRSERDLQDKDALIVDQKRRLDNSARRLMDCSEEKWRLEDKVMSLEGSDRH